MEFKIIKRYTAICCVFFSFQVHANSDKCGLFTSEPLEGMARVVSGDPTAKAKLEDINKFIESHKKAISSRQIDGERLSKEGIADCKRGLADLVSYRKNHYSNGQAAPVQAKASTSGPSVGEKGYVKIRVATGVFGGNYKVIPYVVYVEQVSGDRLKVSYGNNCFGDAYGRINYVNGIGSARARSGELEWIDRDEFFKGAPSFDECNWN